MLPVSPALQAAIQGSHERVYWATIQTPTASAAVLNPAIPFDIQAGDCDQSLTNGRRNDCTITVVPENVKDWADLILTPGALLQAGVRIRTAGSAFESVTYFTGEVSSAPTVSVYGEGFDVAMGDQWIRLDRCRYLTPYTTPAARRSDIITIAVTGAIPYAQVLVSPAATGSHQGGVVVDKLRTDLIVDLGNDGDDLSLGFNAQGQFVINPVPVVDLDTPDISLVDGENGTILDLDRTKAVDRLYNCVVVKPSSTSQGWTAQVIEITDVTHPRHKSKIGIVPYFVNAPTASSASVAQNIGTLTLNRIIQAQSDSKITAIDNPAVEPGDTVWATISTGPNSGEIIKALITNIHRNFGDATMELSVQQDATAALGLGDQDEQDT